MKVSQNTKDRFLHVLYARVAPTRDLYDKRDLYRPFNRSSLSIFTTSRESSHAVTDPDSIPRGRRIKSGCGCFAPVSLDRPICTASSFRSGQTRRLAASIVCRSCDRSTDSLFGSPKIEQLDPRAIDEPVAPCHRSFRRGDRFNYKNKSMKREKNRTAKKSFAPSVLPLARTGPFVALKRVNSSFYASLENTGPPTLPFRHRSYARRE